METHSWSVNCFLMILKNSSSRSSLVSLAWSLVVYHRSLRYTYPNKKNINLAGTLFQFLWHFCSITARAAQLERAKARQQIQLDHGGTVGAVALDAGGRMAAATSTGGMTNKRFGRVGDSPIIGAGTYASNDSCAVSATGHGEFFIRHVVAFNICNRVKSGASVTEAGNTVINGILRDVGGEGGVIIMGPDGDIAMPFNTKGMYRASINAEGELFVGIYGNEP